MFDWLILGFIAIINFWLITRILRGIIRTAQVNLKMYRDMVARHTRETEELQESIKQIRASLKVPKN